MIAGSAHSHRCMSQPWVSSAAHRGTPVDHGSEALARGLDGWLDQHAACCAVRDKLPSRIPVCLAALARRLAVVIWPAVSSSLSDRSRTGRWAGGSLRVTLGRPIHRCMPRGLATGLDIGGPGRCEIVRFDAGSGPSHHSAGTQGATNSPDLYNTSGLASAEPRHWAAREPSCYLGDLPSTTPRTPSTPRSAQAGQGKPKSSPRTWLPPTVHRVKPSGRWINPQPAARRLGMNGGVARGESEGGMAPAPPPSESSGRLRAGRVPRVSPASPKAVTQVNSRFGNLPSVVQHVPC
jgi:hypothetical protein